MAPVLQCPDCGEKHPLSSVPSQGAFPCRGCGRVLKVPEVVTQRAAGQPDAARTPEPVSAPAAARPTEPGRTGDPDVISIEPDRPIPVATAVARPNGPDADVNSTRAMPAVDEQALGGLSSRSGRRPVGRLGSVPWWMRLLLWFIAVPLAFVLVFLVARAFSVFTTNDLSDLFLANGTSRFWPVARLLPFVALMTAIFVQAGVYGLARLRGRRHAVPAGEIGAPVSRPRGR